MYGTLTRMVYFADKLVMTDYYGADLSETARREICASLDHIASVLSGESGIISSEIPFAVAACPEGPLGQTKREKIGSDLTRPQQKLLWDTSGE